MSLAAETRLNFEVSNFPGVKLHDSVTTKTDGQLWTEERAQINQDGLSIRGKSQKEN
jgi:hypothetical protein